MKAMIFAAGLGTRLKPLTDTMPKALVPVDGKPLIEHVACRLRDFGVTEAVVNVHHFADMLEDWTKTQDIMPMKVSDEREQLLDTGGGILNAKGLLQDQEHFIVHNVDIISNLDIDSLAGSMPADALATLAVSDRKTQRYLLFAPETMRLVGWVNRATGQVRSPYPDIDVDKCVAMAFSGIQMVSRDIFTPMEEYVNRRLPSEKADARKFSIIDFYLSVCHIHSIYGMVAEGLDLVDVGKMETLSLVSGKNA